MIGYRIKPFHRSFRTLLTVLTLTPHSAALHVGLKSLAPSRHLHNISYQVKVELCLSTTTKP
ncbi:hypothetical protein Barb6_00690 [Bacteroidales bacterium Barb6]|nr:hypothetical protein Barb6_00690 [Bacteroidales bacterium Barb6]